MQIVATKLCKVALIFVGLELVACCMSPVCRLEIWGSSENFLKILHLWLKHLFVLEITTQREMSNSSALFLLSKFYMCNATASKTLFTLYIDNMINTQTKIMATVISIYKSQVFGFLIWYIYFCFHRKQIWRVWSLIIFPPPPPK